MSRIIKSSHYSTIQEKMLLTAKLPLPIMTEEDAQKLQEQEEKISFADQEAKKIVRDAEEMAEKIMQEAVQQAEQLKQQARQEIEQWWKQKQEEAERLYAATFEEAKENGYAAGLDEGKTLVLQEEREKIEAAAELVRSAHQKKEQIIAEAEPFLIELSTQIAKKIIGDELESSPEKIRDHVIRVLQRSRIHGEITLCVNHKNHALMEENRAQLLSILEGQAELIIYPDYTVQDDGCVIRTALGSIDARIDTQLSEIKQVLLEIARGSEAT
ncbi:hypothetical protein GCM10023228_00370 [Brevibacillus fulvus]|uniref:Flagellar assembly protein FliH n=1 Tax=Brevibacillus fulvus TaxID=1125967 RepID=A0A939BSE8_9BACL|nr:flagellar assembly protein FliH [Brevibacillus fulvus]